LGGRFASFGDLLGFNFTPLSHEDFERRVEHAAGLPGMTCLRCFSHTD
jgi:hypothetical protein